MQRIAYYITAHGYGHGTRSCDILRAVNRLHPGTDVHVVTDLPVDFLRSRIPGPQNHFRRAAFDSGMFQLDSIRVDLARSLAGAERLLARRGDLIAQEREFLRRGTFSAVVADIPAIPLEAARRENLRALAVGNFGWDWIYEEFIAREPRWKPVVEAFRQGYAQADVLLKLPFAEPMAAFPRQVGLPLVCSPGRDRREEMARLHGVDASKKWVLLSFTSLDWDAAALARVSALRDFEFFTVMPLAWPHRANLHAVDRHAVPFADVLATADIVVSKPGFGILSECCANDKPLVFAERTDFREYPILEAAVARHLRGVHIPAERLYAGELESHLQAALRTPPAREPLPGGGAELAAGLICG